MINSSFGVILPVVIVFCIFLNCLSDVEASKRYSRQVYLARLSDFIKRQQPIASNATFGGNPSGPFSWVEQQRNLTVHRWIQTDDSQHDAKHAVLITQSNKGGYFKALEKYKERLDATWGTVEVTNKTESFPQQHPYRGQYLNEIRHANHTVMFSAVTTTSPINVTTSFSLPLLLSTTLASIVLQYYPTILEQPPNALDFFIGAHNSLQLVKTLNNSFLPKANKTSRVRPVARRLWLPAIPKRFMAKPNQTSSL